ncbi:MAG: type II toxin-antitoxin system prevent-host-death family antitoxin [Bacteroidota bacterium]
MSKITLSDASKRLPDLVEQAARGEEVIITRGDGAAFKLTPVVKETPRPTFGSARGLVVIGDDFDEPLSDFDAYAP